MTTLSADGVDLYYEMAGDGDALVMVHGSWGDHANWALVVPELSRSFRVITYDRRGHSQSTGDGTTRDDVDDLARIIEELGPAAVHLVGNSFGAIISLKLATSRPELLRSVFVHEPPLFNLLRADPASKTAYEITTQRTDAVVELLAAGDAEAGARLFVDTIAFGPGAWDTLPEPIRATFVRNAMTWLDEMRDPDSLGVELDALKLFTKPMVLSEGDKSAPVFGPVVAMLREVLPGAEHHVFAGAGHVPHNTHPADYVAKLTEFLARV
jgi:pimeloyl-ACP methyl ester carboxylesterase